MISKMKGTYDVNLNLRVKVSVKLRVFILTEVFDLLRDNVFELLGPPALLDHVLRIHIDLVQFKQFFFLQGGVWSFELM